MTDWRKKRWTRNDWSGALTAAERIELATLDAEIESLHRALALRYSSRRLLQNRGTTRARRAGVKPGMARGGPAP